VGKDGEKPRKSKQASCTRAVVWDRRWKCCHAKYLYLEGKIGLLCVSQQKLPDSHFGFGLSDGAVTCYRFCLRCIRCILCKLCNLQCVSWLPGMWWNPLAEKFMYRIVEVTRQAYAVQTRTKFPNQPFDLDGSGFQEKYPLPSSILWHYWSPSARYQTGVIEHTGLPVPQEQDGENPSSNTYQLSHPFLWNPSLSFILFDLPVETHWAKYLWPRRLLPLWSGLPLLPLSPK
jgi:hypothetical protein